MGTKRLTYDEQLLKIKAALEQKRYWMKKYNELKILADLRFIELGDNKKYLEVAGLICDKVELENQNLKLYIRDLESDRKKMHELMGLLNQADINESKLTNEVRVMSESLQSATDFGDRTEREINQLRESCDNVLNDLKVRLSTKTSANIELMRQKADLEKLQIKSHNEAYLLKRSVQVWRVGCWVCLAFMFLCITAWAYFAR